MTALSAVDGYVGRGDRTGLPTVVTRRNEYRAVKRHVYLYPRDACVLRQKAISDCPAKRCIRLPSQWHCRGQGKQQR
jgi:hypothetical protein